MNYCKEEKIRKNNTVENFRHINLDKSLKRNVFSASLPLKGCNAKNSLTIYSASHTSHFTSFLQQFSERVEFIWGKKLIAAESY